MKNATFRNTTSAALLLGAAFACGPASVADTDSEVVDQAQSGSIKLDTLPNGPLEQQKRISVSFLEADASTKCTVREEGPCRLIECPSARSSLRSKSAGKLTVTSKTSGASTPLIYDDGMRSYVGSGATNNGALFAGNDGLNTKADGAYVGAFDMSVTAPSLVTVTSPTDTMLAINRNQDFNIAWSGASSGQFVFQIVGLPPANLPNLECRFDGKSSSGVIPKAALQLLPAGTYNADAFTRTRLVQSVGDWKVSVDARFFAAVGNNPYKRSASLQ